MFRYSTKLFLAAAVALAVIALAVPAMAFNLAWPTPGQAVREAVRIAVPAGALPDGYFVAVHLGVKGQEVFVQAMNRQSGKLRNGYYNFYWNSKSTYRDQSDPKNEKSFKDGPYSMVVRVHDPQGRSVNSAQVDIRLANKVPRSSPAPAVTLANRLSFGQTRIYGVNASVQVFDAVNLPILGGMGMTSHSRITQSVEDVRPNGEYLLRYRVGEDAFVSSLGQKMALYANQDYRPQLYRLISKYGQVIKSNMFQKQAMFSIMDVLPVLPKKTVKEGDSWSDKLSLKIEGITNPFTLEGTAMLDSFEWQNGQECVKIISRLSGETNIAINNGKVRSSGGNVQAVATTYFAYKTGKLIRRDIKLDFPAFIEQGAGDIEGLDMSGSTPGASFDDDEDEPAAAPRAIGPMMMPPGMLPPPGAGRSTTATGSAGADRSNMAKRGSVQINVAVQAES